MVNGNGDTIEVTGAGIENIMDISAFINERGLEKRRKDR
jgi:hypothetical protein